MTNRISVIYRCLAVQGFAVKDFFNLAVRCLSMYCLLISYFHSDFYKLNIIYIKRLTKLSNLSIICIWLIKFKDCGGYKYEIR